MSQKQIKRYRRQMMKQRRAIVGTYLDQLLSAGIFKRIIAALSVLMGK